MKSLASAVALLVAMPCLASAKAQPEQTPKPAPEVLKLGYYIGSWKGHGETKGGPFGPAGKLSSHMNCNWFAGHFQVVCQGEETGPTGRRAFLNILSYDPTAKSYTEYAVSSLGDTEYDRGGIFAGNKLTYMLDAGTSAKPARVRYTEERLSPDLYTYKADVSLGGGPWKPIAEGNITRVK